ncbi:hypothetical protein ACFYYR_08285 [Streptomyces sp. NPDC001922]|uniref:hypothetical protein n=1 Tax=Streptomyces sp. NPDC001922 TaxID=3364624 RepID=UPI00369C3BA7
MERLFGRTAVARLLGGGLTGGAAARALLPAAAAAGDDHHASFAALAGASVQAMALQGGRLLAGPVLTT